MKNGWRLVGWGLLLGALSGAVGIWPADGCAGAVAEGRREAVPGNRSIEKREVDDPFAEAYWLLDRGQVNAAIRAFEAGLQQGRSAADPRRQSLAENGLATALLATGRIDDARRAVERARALAATASDAAALARIEITSGNLLALHGSPESALDAYRRAAELAGATLERAIRGKALLNQARLAQSLRRIEEAGKLLDDARAEILPLPNSAERAALLIGAGEVADRLANASRPQPMASDGAAIDLLHRGLDTARAIGDDRLVSYALGEIGAILERRQAYAEALGYTLAAGFAAQAADVPTLGSRWDWQAGRVLRRLGRDDAALDAYRRAIHALQRGRDDVGCDLRAKGVGVRAAIGSLFVEAADLVLQRARIAPGGEAVQALLREAREITERAKSEELQDYFQDDCVTALGARIISLDELATGTAVIYPIVLPDRLELLVAIGSRLDRVTVDVSAAALELDVRGFRRALQRFRGSEFLPYAQRLYDRLIRPIDSLLASGAVDALVFVPDQFLRTIPMAPLHSGTQFLIERYAVATTPGLTLTDPRPLEARNSRVFAGGLTQAVQGFPPLPAVAAELAQLQVMYGATVLQDSEFTSHRLAAELEGGPYRIVHIATHGRIEADVRKSFLLTHDARLTMDDLDRLIGLKKHSRTPVELLTLSACETALGDDRSALGLAGIAVKAGARSAVATLWSISDDATTVLMLEFFRQLRTGTTSRALALQRAQRHTLADSRFAHPGYWAPFLLIGGWL
jgi:CHAT domain-containing protein